MAAAGRPHANSPARSLTSVQRRVNVARNAASIADPISDEFIDPMEIETLCIIMWDSPFSSVAARYLRE